MSVPFEQVCQPPQGQANQAMVRDNPSPSSTRSRGEIGEERQLQLSLISRLFLGGGLGKKRGQLRRRKRKRRRNELNDSRWTSQVSALTFASATGSFSSFPPFFYFFLFVPPYFFSHFLPRPLQPPSPPSLCSLPPPPFMKTVLSCLTPSSSSSFPSQHFYSIFLFVIYMLFLHLAFLFILFLTYPSSSLLFYNKKETNG